MILTGFAMAHIMRTENFRSKFKNEINFKLSRHWRAVVRSHRKRIVQFLFRKIHLPRTDLRSTIKSAKNESFSIDSAEFRHCGHHFEFRDEIATIQLGISKRILNTWLIDHVQLDVYIFRSRYIGWIHAIALFRITGSRSHFFFDDHGYQCEEIVSIDRHLWKYRQYKWVDS